MDKIFYGKQREKLFEMLGEPDVDTILNTEEPEETLSAKPELTVDEKVHKLFVQAIYLLSDYYDNSPAIAGKLIFKAYQDALNLDSADISVPLIQGIKYASKAY